MSGGLLGAASYLLSPQMCVLLVVDKQRWYLDAGVSPFLTDTESAVVQHEVAEHDRFVRAARSAGVPVMWTQMAEGAADAPANVLARWQRRPLEPSLCASDPGHDFVGERPAEGEDVFDKLYPDAFSVPGLGRRIESLRRSTVVIIGGYAGRCVLASAFGAQNHGLHVVVPRGLAEPHPRHVEEENVALEIIDSVIGYVVDCEPLLTAWT